MNIYINCVYYLAKFFYLVKDMYVDITKDSLIQLMKQRKENIEEHSGKYFIC